MTEFTTYSPSWSSSVPHEDHFSLRQQTSPSPPPSWSSSPSSKDRVPLFQWPVAGWAPVRGRPAITGASSRMRVESPEWTTSTVTDQELANIRACCQISSSVRLFLPTSDDRVVSFRPGRVAIYEVSLRIGLRLPYHPFFNNLLDRYSLTPA